MEVVGNDGVKKIYQTILNDVLDTNMSRPFSCVVSGSTDTSKYARILTFNNTVSSRIHIQVITDDIYSVFGEAWLINGHTGLVMTASNMPFTVDQDFRFYYQTEGERTTIYLFADYNPCIYRIHGEVISIDMSTTSPESYNSDFIKDSALISKLNVLGQIYPNEWYLYDAVNLQSQLIVSELVSPAINSDVNLGGPSYRFNCIYLSSSPNVTSDRNSKTDITDISDKYIQLFNMLKPVSFKFIDGTSGRTHIGFIAQDVEQAMNELGLDAVDFAGFCKDTKTIEVTDEHGKRKVEPATDDDGNPIYQYSLRYEEFIALNTAIIKKQQEEINELKKEIKEIKSYLQK